ncbi:MAG: DEAD/DEAH box helicase [Promethearchaeia archaeon]
MELGRNKPELWFNPVRPIPSKPPERLIFQTKFLKEKGKEYEEMVYSYLKHLDNIHYNGFKGKVEDSKLNQKALMGFYNKCQRDPSDSLLLLLEYEFKIPRSFFYNIFAKKAKAKDIPVGYSSQRPDLIFLGNRINQYIDPVYEILADGTIQKVPKEDENKRLGVSLFDIKYTKEENISKKHYIEIFYYLKTLASFLKRENLEDKFYVRANFNGILPLRDEKQFKKLKSTEDIFKNELMSFVSWKESNRIYDKVINAVKSLWRKAPCPIDQIRTNIHDGCGYCQFIEDCKTTLGMKETNEPKDWSVKLIPFTSKSIAQQLIKEFNINTIGDLKDKIEKIKVERYPKPLYSELPTLKLKTRAIINKRMTYPKNSQAYSYAIPKYSPLVLNFDVEYDSNTDRIFTVGILLKMFVSSKLKYHGIFDNWWRIWKEALAKEKNTKQIQEELNHYLIRAIPLEHVALFLNCLNHLKKLEINLRGEKTSAGTSIMYRYARVNKDITPESEAELTIKTIKTLNLVLQMCNIIEDYVVIDIEGKYGKYSIGPDTSIFYWSPNQLEHLQDMIQRNLEYVLEDKKAKAAYESILMYFTPSDDEVNNPFQYKKLFDVQKFAESYVGFPNVINYTWHSIAEQLFDMEINKKMYWVPHFNFLDLSSWLLYLREQDSKKKIKKKKIIQKQVIYKLHMIDSIRNHFQKEATMAISENARTISRHDYQSTILPSDYHDIAHVWFLFSMLNNAIQQQEDEYYRTMFPDFSIGKLVSGRVTNLTKLPHQGKKIQYSFILKGLSSNMKLQEDDKVLLLPNFKRGLRLNSGAFKWTVDIEEIQWDSSLEGNRVITKPTRHDVFRILEKMDKDPHKQDWFLYPFGIDAWSKKLYNANPNSRGLLQRENFGRSWLGKRLVYLWNLRSASQIKWPENWSFTTPSIYLYAPFLLDHFNKQTEDNDLYTNISPTPDPSQKEAILNSLNKVISAILGPPGTGKSQTIAAFIDEFITRRKKKNKSAKILITSFSYAALRVVIEKIRKSKDDLGNPTPSSQTQMIFLRSSTQDKIEKISGCKDVDDIVRKGNTWKWNGKTRTITPTNLLEEHLKDDYIIFANAHQLFYLPSRVEKDFAFDLICVDEASQLPVDYFMSSLQFVHKPKIEIEKPSEMVSGERITNEKLINPLQISPTAPTPDRLTKIVVVGDHNQLPPVRVKNPPKNLELILDNIFRYYVEEHHISKRQLKINYRSHRDIVEFTSLLGLYEDLRAHKQNANALLRGNLNNIEKSWIKAVLNPEKVVCSLVHEEKFEIGVSTFEAQLVAEIVKGFYKMISPQNAQEEYNFWSNKIGVVAPHNAQGRTIIRKIFNLFESITELSKDKLMQSLKSTVYSVEKFQGSDRDLIICSIGLSDEDKLQMEEEFIYNLNRFNVLTSRAKNKIIFVSSEKYIQYIPNERELLKNSSKIYMFVKDFCNKEQTLHITNKSIDEKQKVKLRYKS